METKVDTPKKPKLQFFFTDRIVHLSTCPAPPGAILLCSYFDTNNLDKCVIHHTQYSVLFLQTVVKRQYTWSSYGPRATPPKEAGSHEELLENGWWFHDEHTNTSYMIHDDDLGDGPIAHDDSVMAGCHNEVMTLVLPPYRDLESRMKDNAEELGRKWVDYVQKEREESKRDEPSTN